MSVNSEKSALRAAMRSRRKAFVRDRQTHLSGRLAERVLGRSEDLWLTAGVRTAAYWPMPDEADLRPTLERLHGAGVRCALPVVVAPAKPLVFREWRPGLEMEKGALGIWQPPETESEITPAVLLMPLLAFDRRGWRLGQGGGYYDRTLTELRRRGGVRAVGIGYSCQEVESVPHETTDARLDWVVTEEAVFEAETV